MNIVVFGTGNIYRKYRHNIDAKDKIVAFLDNNQLLQGTKLEEIEIHNPLDIKIIEYDKIVIMSGYFLEMKSQLLSLGCSREDILHYTEYISHQKKGQLQIYFGKKKKAGVVITSSLGYHGGSVTAVYLALELSRRGYEMTVAAPEGDSRFIEEFQVYGLNFILYPNLQFADWKELFWIQQFEKIIVNTYPMILCALEISKYRKTILWLHESNIVYQSMEYWKDIVMDRIPTANVDIYAVSNVARRNFENNIMKCPIGILPYGIPDRGVKETRADHVLRFAIIGIIHPVKRQLFFLEAIEQLKEIERLKCEFLIIGEAGSVSEYAEQVTEKALGIGQVIMVGGLTQRDLDQKYQEIDVLVIAAEQETMSLIATEAMMFGKTCILCDVAGMAEFVTHGQNGLIFHTDDINTLVEQIRFCIYNRSQLAEIGKNARKTYEENFTMKVFGDRVEKNLPK